MFVYKPIGVCSKEIHIELDGNIVKEVSFVGGCSGNTQGVGALIVGMDVQEAIGRIRGIRCGMRQTSCPDQLANALEAALKEREHL